MFEATAGLPEQIESAVAAVAPISEHVRELAAPDGKWVQNVAVIGMGGSGVAGDVLLATAGAVLPVPAVVVKDYLCPAYVGEGSLVFAISASGDTEETIEASTQAVLNGARVVAVTGGGELARLAEGWGAPVILVPGHLPQPRTAIAAMAIPPLVVLEDLGLYRGARAWIAQAVDHLKRRRDQFVAGGEASPPAAVARRVGRTWPLVQGGGPLGAAAAQRWKTQMNENAKAPAFWSAQPELCHNEVCGWGQHGDVTRQLITAIDLRHDAEHPQLDRRFELVAELMREVVADVIEVRAAGDGELAQLFDLILFGDYVSLWMAADAGVDPGPVPILGQLKQALAGEATL